MRPHRPLVYVIQEFPTLTQGFVTAEIRALRERGSEVVVYPLRAGDARGVRDGLDDVVIPPPARVARLLVDVARWSPRPRAAAPLLRAVTDRPAHPKQAVRRLYALAHALRLAERLDERLGDVPVHLHAHFAARAADVARLTAAMRGDTYSVTAHAVDLFAPDDERALARRLGDATFVACIARYGRAHVLDRGLVDDPARVVTIPMGIDLEKFPVRNAEPNGVPTILGVGRLVEKKGFGRLIEAAAALRDEGRSFRVVIAGDGPLALPLRRQARSLGCAEVVQFAGALDHAGVRRLYREAAVFVMPCVVAADGDRDGVPTVLLEAMASGVPVVSTPISGVPELISDGEDGILVLPDHAGALAAAIGALLDDAERRRRLAAAARRTVEAQRDLRRQAAAVHDAMRRFDCLAAPHGPAIPAHSTEVPAHP